jgi:hypothetical protein
VLTWMCDKRELVSHVTLWNDTKSTFCNNMTNNDNDDNVIHASVWFVFFGGVIYVQTHDIWEET